MQNNRKNHHFVLLRQENNSYAILCVEKIKSMEEIAGGDVKTEIRYMNGRIYEVREDKEDVLMKMKEARAGNAYG